MKAAYALDCCDLTVHYRTTHLAYRFTTLDILTDDVKLGSAVITAHGLSVVTSCRGAVVLFCTLRAHRELLHAGALTVIGHSV